MPLLTIAPLAAPACLTAASREAICASSALFLQTAEHPSAKWIVSSGMQYQSMDDLYRQAEDFDALNLAIAGRLMCGRDAVYAVPGRRPGEAQLGAILSAAQTHGVEVRILPSAGYFEAALALIPSAPSIDGARVLAATALPQRVDPCVPLAVEEIDTPMRAGEVKLALTEYYPSDFLAWFCTMDASGSYRCRSIPLYELDRQSAGDYFAATTLILRAARFDELTRHGIEGLEAVVRRLRAPGGCPWDAEQDHVSLKTALIEESYEVLDAIDKTDASALCEELGDLLLQIVFHALIEEEVASFGLRDVTTGIVDKLVYRHPHVFGDVHVRDSEEVLVNWEQLKKKEKHFLTATDTLEAVPKNLPALMRASKVQKRAADVGFDWDSALPALGKVHEEADELRSAIDSGDDEAHVLEELGDLLFACVNVSRLLKYNGELALGQATEKFIRRFDLMEREIRAADLQLETMSLAELDKFWNRAKERFF